MRDIQWRAWSDAAFDESKATGKPVLLSISAAWCHWCHVMDETTYSDPVVTSLINEHFIPVRVDTDRNPDINARYNMGGWPSTVFLTHEREIIAGATYVPPDEMVKILQRVSTAYTSRTESILAQAREFRTEREQRESALQPGKVGIKDVENILASIRSSYDKDYGGFGTDYKFPFPDVLALLLISFERTRKERDLEMVVHTLECMLQGEIFDKVEGGMFRYATKPDWTEPHYEKILGDNADMAFVLLETYRLTGREEFLQTALGIFQYAEKTLRDEKTGLFFGSQDAVESYYKADEAGRKRMQPPDVDTAAYTSSNAAMVKAYLKLWGTAKEPHARDRALDIVSFLNNLDRGPDDTVCRYYEDNRPHGFGILADHASLMLANVECYEATGRDEYIDVAKDLALSLECFAAESRGLYDISAARAHERGLSRSNLPLDDNAIAAIALTKLGRLTDDRSYADRAEAILDSLANQYQDYGIAAALYGIAVTLVVSEPIVITVRASSDKPAREKFLQASMGLCNSTCTVRVEEDLAKGEDTAAIVCVGSSCLGRVTDPDKLAEQLAAAYAVSRVPSRD